VLLSRITSLQVEELFINISEASAMEFEVWAKIDLQLDRPQFSNLRRLKFSFDFGWRAGDIRFIKDRLPLCTTRRIILFP
jgi:hypothetical protein